MCLVLLMAMQRFILDLFYCTRLNKFNFKPFNFGVYLVVNFIFKYQNSVYLFFCLKNTAIFIISLEQGEYKNQFVEILRNSLRMKNACTLKETFMLNTGRYFTLSANVSIMKIKRNFSGIRWTVRTVALKSWLYSIFLYSIFPCSTFIFNSSCFNQLFHTFIFLRKFFRK